MSTAKTLSIEWENVGYIDKTTRIFLAMVFIFIVLLGQVAAPTDIFALSVAAIYLITTGIVSVDPIYIPLQLTSKGGTGFMRDLQYNN